MLVGRLAIWTAGLAGGAFRRSPQGGGSGFTVCPRAIIIVIIWYTGQSVIICIISIIISSSSVVSLSLLLLYVLCVFHVGG